MIRIDLELVDSTLAGMTYPARRWELVAWAEFNAAGRLVVDSLLALPDRSFADADDVVRAARGGGSEPVSLCQHRRHPRSCPLHIGSKHWPVPMREWHERGWDSGIAS